MTLGSRVAVFLEPQGFVTTQASQMISPDGLNQARGSVIHEVHKSKSVQPHLVESQALRVFSSYFGSSLKRPDALGIPFHNHRL